MPDPTWLIFLVIGAAIIFDFTNGMNDAANAIATVVSTRVLKPLQAVALAATINVIGALFFTAVAKTVAKGIVDPERTTQLVVLGALIGGIVWNGSMTYLGMPVSASHAIIGAMVGSAFAHGGLSMIRFAGLSKVFIGMLFSPILGFLVGIVLMRVIYRLVGNWPPAFVNRHFRWMQLISVSFMSFTHGTNDAQQVRGVITLALFAGGYIPTIDVPLWVKLTAAAGIGLGTLAGGWKVIKTLGMRVLDIKPVHGFAAETGASIVLLAATGLGIPVSTTHTITGSILGVGAGTRLKAVRWGIASKIIYAWVFTLPGAALISYLSYQLISRL